MNKIRLLFALSIFCTGHSFGQPLAKGLPRNLIIVSVNGLGMNQIAAGALKKGSMISFSNLKTMGFVQAWPSNGKQPSDSLTAEAICTGKLQMGIDRNSKTLFDVAKAENMKTGMITTNSVTGITPKNFVFENPGKKDDEALALDYLNSNLDIIVGGGSKYFDKRYDGRNLFKEFKNKGYNLESKLSGISNPKPKKTIALLETDGIYRASERKDFLTKAALFASGSMEGEAAGYLLIIDDSKIEEADSLNNTTLLSEEMLDLDKLVSALIERAGSETLILVTGNYEDGGLELKDANINSKSEPDVIWRSKKPTPALAPVFAKGPGADQFSGFYSQADIFKKLSGLITSRH